MTRKPPQKPKVSPRRRAARFVAGLAVVLVLAVWGVQEVWGETHWVSAVITYAPPIIYLAIPGIALVLALFALDLRALLWALGAGGLCLLGVARPSVSLSRPKAPVARTLRVVTWNIHDRLDHLPELREQLDRLDPDIVCLQEANARGFRELWPSAEVVQEDSLVIMTHGAIEGHRVIRLREEGHYLRPLLEAEVVVDGMRLTVLDAHLYSFQLAAAVKNPSPERAQEVAEGAVEMRSLQLQKVVHWLESQTGPAIVAGDFNTPPRGRLYGRLTQVATDAFAASGEGFGWTFPSSHPALRIDYVWTTREVQAVRCYRVPGGPSDHCAVVADIAVP